LPVRVPEKLEIVGLAPSREGAEYISKKMKGSRVLPIEEAERMGLTIKGTFKKDMITQMLVKTKYVVVREPVSPPIAARVHYERLREFMFKPARTQSIPYLENVVDWIIRCRVTDGGIPYFRTGFAKKDFRENQTLYVQGICYLGRDLVNSQWFKDVPGDDFEHMKHYHDDYLYILSRHASEAQVHRAKEAPVVV